MYIQKVSVKTCLKFNNKNLSLESQKKSWNVFEISKSFLIIAICNVLFVIIYKSVELNENNSDKSCL